MVQAGSGAGQRATNRTRCTGGPPRIAPVAALATNGVTWAGRRPRIGAVAASGGGPRAKTAPPPGGFWGAAGAGRVRRRAEARAGA